MSNRLANYLIAGALASALALASPALAFRGGGMGGGFHRFEFIGVPFAYVTNYCWRRVWTRYGLQWVNAAFSSCSRSRRAGVHRTRIAAIARIEVKRFAAGRPAESKRKPGASFRALSQAETEALLGGELLSALSGDRRRENRLA